MQGMLEQQKILLSGNVEQTNRRTSHAILPSKNELPRMEKTVGLLAIVFLVISAQGQF